MIRSTLVRIVLLASSLCLTQTAAFADAAQLLATAETEYRQGHFETALPLYVQASDEPAPSVDDQAQRLRYLGDCYCKCNQPEQALSVFKKIEALLPADAHEQRARNAMDQAVCALMLSDDKQSDALAQTAMKEARLVTGDPAAALLARAHALIAYIDYGHGRWAEGAKGFEQAATLNEQSKSSRLDQTTFAMKLDFSTAGAYYHLGRFDKAAEYFQKMHDADEILFGANDVQSGWSHLALSDALGKIGQREKSQANYAEAIRIFRKFNRDKLIEEYAASLPEGKDKAELVARVTHCVFGNHPLPDKHSQEAPLCSSHLQIIATHDPCSAFVRPFEDAPGRVWSNPWVEQKGIVIGVHGLSLQHSSYDALARKLADAGYTTVAFDMRGFGTYRQALGADQLDFNGCMSDLHSVVRAIRGDNTTLPMFLLGESMGGAIAVQFAAQHPELITGLVAAVPAGKRFKERRTALKVAMRYLEDRNKPFNIGADVINQATSNPQLKSQWANDPMTRSNLTPQELVRFQEMLNKNLDYARQITSVPVIVFQGVGDKLVKPEATYQLFQTIGAKDKSLVMVGNTEHLIFEEGCFTPAVLSGLVSWMDSHLQKQ